eukprot:scaffold13308_cov186-Alexandrium_tamarense.AAC.6
MAEKVPESSPAVSTPEELPILPPMTKSTLASSAETGTGVKVDEALKASVADTANAEASPPNKSSDNTVSVTKEVSYQESNGDADDSAWETVESKTRGRKTKSNNDHASNNNNSSNNNNKS